MYEIEMKTSKPIIDPEIYRKKLGEPVEILEFIDTVYDTHDLALENSDRFIRVRDYGDNAVLTYKGPRQESIAKKREEYEIETKDIEALHKILKSTGYIPQGRYSRVREVYHFMDAEVEIDKFPKIGFFLEVEAKDEDTVLKVFDALGISKDKLTSKTYLELIDEYKERTGEEFTDLVF